jgi:hypothetical protein
MIVQSEAKRIDKKTSSSQKKTRVDAHAKRLLQDHECYRTKAKKQGTQEGKAPAFSPEKWRKSRREEWNETHSKNSRDTCAGVLIPRYCSQ